MGSCGLLQTHASALFSKLFLIMLHVLERDLCNTSRGEAGGKWGRGTGRPEGRGGEGGEHNPASSAQLLVQLGPSDSER